MGVTVRGTAAQVNLTVVLVAELVGQSPSLLDNAQCLLEFAAKVQTTEILISRVLKHNPV